MTCTRRRIIKAIYVPFLVCVLAIWGSTAFAQEWPYENVKKGELEGTVSFWSWHATLEETWNSALEASGFFQDYPGIKVRYEKMGGQPDKILVAAIAGEGLPSMMRIDNSWYAGFVQKGILQDLTDRLMPLKDEFFPLTWSNALINNRLYCLADLLQPVGMMYRRDILEKAGFLSDPDRVSDSWPTWDEFIEVGKKVIKATGGYMFMGGPNYPRNWRDIENMVTTGYFDKEGNILLDSPELTMVAKTLKRVWDSGIATEYPDSVAQWFQALRGGEVATLLAPSWLPNFIAISVPETVGLWGMAKAPAFYEEGRRVWNQSLAALAISKNVPAKEKEMAWRVIRYCAATTEGMKAFMVGKAGWLGNFYAYIPAIEAITDVELPVLAGQKQYEFFLKLLQEEDPLPIYAPPGAEKAAKLWNDSLYKILKEGADVEQVLSEAAEKFRKEMGQ